MCNTDGGNALFKWSLAGGWTSAKESACLEAPGERRLAVS